MAGKLHEVLAVEAGLKRASRNTVDEAITTFTKRAEHFSGHDRHYECTVEGDPSEADQEIVDRQELVTTVHDKLAYVFDHITKHIDCMASKDATNQVARADIIIDGKPLVEAVPVTTLLSLEDEVSRWREMILRAPTLAPGKEWVPATDQGDNVFKLKFPEKKTRTRKIYQNHVLAKATKEHPAQVQTYTSETPIGMYITNRISGALTVAEKSAMLDRVDTLFRAVKKARQRANGEKVVEKNIGSAMARFILG